MNKKDVVLEVKNLTKKYIDFTLSNVSFELKRGTVTGFVGQNGSGKTTTIKSIMGFMNFEGEILYNGKAFNQKENIGYIGETGDIYPKIKIKKLTKFYSKAYKDWDNEKFKHLFYDVFKLNDNLLLQELSSGMRTKYFLSLALSKNSELIILDEPTTGLDPVVRADLLKILHNLAEKENKTIFFSSHIMEDIDEIADNIIFIQDGRIILSGRKADIKTKYPKLQDVLLEKSNEVSFCYD
ncbi:MAG: ABC transporter ATP-binding protein [Oscillospiraceae bacterium]|jgi:ABC-2 type transport system ATP-binding protein|nr:ABC transporter ATP-binding protein [Oscillospiraceae bacterium]